jgi:hypothetical protein
MTSSSTIRPAAALAGLLAAVSLYACGGGAGAESTATAGSRAERPVSTDTPEVGLREKTPRDGRTNRVGGARAGRRSGIASAPRAQANAPSNGMTTNHRGGKECPHGVSKFICEQIAALHGGKVNAPRARNGECPPAVSRNICKTLTRVYETEHQRNGPAFEPGKCPPSFSPEQCKQLAEALAK